MNFSRQRRHRLGAILVLGWTILAHGSVNDADLQKQYGGQVLTLRQFYPGEHLHFDAAGKLARIVSSGAWTVDGQVQVKDISLKDGLVRIRGQRLFLFFDPETKQLRDLGSMAKNDKARELFRKRQLDRWTAQKGQIEIEVECGVAQPEMADLTKAMNAVFLAPEESLTEVVPEFWKNYLAPKTERTNRVHESVPIIPRGKGVSPPRTLHSPDPSYRGLARQAGYQAVTVLWLIVDRDGLPRDIRVTRPAGMGLDEAAIDAVRTWKFDPARKDGEPVAVQINVEVSFRL